MTRLPGFKEYGREATLLLLRPRFGTRAYARDTQTAWQYTIAGWQQMTPGATGTTGGASIGLIIALGG